MTETVAHDRAEYVERAVEVASDLPRLAEWRRQLRPRCLASPLYDGPAFVRELMQALRKVWQQWVEQHPQ
jgi:predicted O-linked N-acetylglucosamine transferase (SPINDLY family)